MRHFALGCSALLLAATLAQGQNFTTAPCGSSNDSDGSWFGRQERACELRRTTLPLTNGHLGVSGNNGGIEVVGEDRSDVALEVKVTAQASSQSDAEALLHQVRIVTNGSDIRAEGPRPEGGFFSHRNWSASFRLHVPRRVAHADLSTSNGAIHVENIEGQVAAHTTNGGIEATHVHGDLRAETTNGGLRLDDLGGAVHAETTNGGVHISLAGDRWHGDGLFASSTNGGITVKAPDHFAAHLVADTTNGGISVGFPITVQGKIGHHLDTELNGGGPPVHLETTNGGVTIERL